MQNPEAYPDPTYIQYPVPYLLRFTETDVNQSRERGKGNGHVGGGGEGAGLTGRSESTLGGASRVRGRFSERPPSVPRRLDPQRHGWKLERERERERRPKVASLTAGGDLHHRQPNEPNEPNEP